MRGTAFLKEGQSDEQDDAGRDRATPASVGHDDGGEEGRKGGFI